MEKQIGAQYGVRRVGQNRSRKTEYDSNGKSDRVLRKVLEVRVVDRHRVTASDCCNIRGFVTAVHTILHAARQYNAPWYPHVLAQYWTFCTARVGR